MCLTYLGGGICTGYQRMIQRSDLMSRNSHASWGVAAPIVPTKLAVLTILPPVCKPFDSSVGFSRIASIAYLHPHHTPLTLILMVRSQILSSVLSALSSSGCIIPEWGTVKSDSYHLKTDLPALLY